MMTAVVMMTTMTMDDDDNVGDGRWARTRRSSRHGWYSKNGPKGSAWVQVIMTAVVVMMMTMMWAMGENLEIFYRQGTYGENGCEGCVWVQVMMTVMMMVVMMMTMVMDDDDNVGGGREPGDLLGRGCTARTVVRGPPGFR